MTRLIRLLRAPRAAIDLVSIMVGVIVVSVLAGAAGATVFAVIPWSQEAAAQQDLAGVVEAESLARLPDPSNPADPLRGRFLSSSDLVAAGLLPVKSTVAVKTDAAGSCFVAVSTAPNGHVFMATDRETKPRLYLGDFDSCTDVAQLAVAVGGATGMTGITNLVHAPSFEVPGSTVTRTNLATDPAATSFAYGDGQAGWRSSRWGADGPYSLVTGAVDGPATTGLTTYARKTISAPAGASRGGFEHTRNNPEAIPSGPPGTGLSVTAGTTYTVSGYVRTSASSKTATVRAKFTDDTGAWITGITDGATVPLSAGVWARPYLTVAAPAGATGVALETIIDGTTSWVVGDRMDGTGLLVEKSATVGVYFSGATADPDFPSSWAGPANASTSTQTATMVAGVTQAANNRALSVQSTQWAKTGTKSVRVIPTVPTDGLVNATYATFQLTGLKVGATYTVIGTHHLSAPLTGALSSTYAGKFWVTDRFTNPPITFQSVAPNTTGDHEVRGTFTADDTGIELRLGHGGVAGSGNVWWDDVIMVENTSSPYAGQYFDGNTVLPGGDRPVWNGVPGRSTSSIWLYPN